MIQFNWYIVLVAALVPMAVGMIWYNPRVLGSAWMRASGMTEEKAKGANKALIFGISILFSLMMAFVLSPITIHQMGFLSTFEGDPALADPASPLNAYIKDYFDQYGSRFRTFKHGALHGFITGLFLGVPAIGFNALYERKSFSYLAINAGYFILCLTLMGGIICAYL